MKLSFWLATLCLTLLTSCATTGYYFDSDAKTPPSAMAKLLIGYGVSVSSINGKPVKFGPGPAIVNVRAGDYVVKTDVVYHFRSGNLAHSASTDSSLVGIAFSMIADADLEYSAAPVEVHVLPQQTWFMGMEFSRSVLEVPRNAPVLPTGSTDILDSKTPQARLVVKEINWQPSVALQPALSAEFYTAPMPPFFSNDSTQVFRAGGGTLKVVELAHPSKVTEIKVADADLIWGEMNADGSCWILDVKGNQYVVDPQTKKILRTQPGKGELDKVISAVGTSSGVYVQTGPAELKKVDSHSLMATSIWKGSSPLMDWTASREKESFAVLTATTLGLYDSQGKELARRLLSKTEINTLDLTAIRDLSLSPDGATLAFHDAGHRLWFLPTDDLTSFPVDQWKFLGYSASELVPAQVIRWFDGQKKLALLDSGIPGADFSAIVFDTTGANASPTLVEESQFGEVLRVSGSNGQSMTVIVGGAVSPDGKKFAFLITGYVRTFYGVIVLDTTRERPKKVN